MGATCAIQKCDRAAWARGMCHAHLQKFYTYGDPLAGSTRGANGTGYIDRNGYHRRSEDGIEKPEHVRIAEKALGKPLPAGAVVHHVDTNRTNNDAANLVICPDPAYHSLIHQRMRAMEACGNPNWRKCCRCGEYSASENVRVSGSQAYHPACNRAHAAKYQKAAA